MKLITISFMLLLIVGCNPCKRLWQRCPPQQFDSVRVDSVVRLDTLVFVTPSDTVYLGEATLEELGLAFENEDQKVTVTKVSGKKVVQFICKEDSLKAVIRSLEYLLDHQTAYVKEKVVYVPQVKTPRWAWYTLGFSIFAILAVVGYFYVRRGR